MKTEAHIKSAVWEWLGWQNTEAIKNNLKIREQVGTLDVIAVEATSCSLREFFTLCLNTSSSFLELSRSLSKPELDLAELGQVTPELSSSVHSINI